MPKRKATFYGVRVGHQPGVYESWEDCKRQVSGFPGNEYKGFSTRLEAENYVINISASSRSNGALGINNNKSAKTNHEKNQPPSEKCLEQRPTKRFKVVEENKQDFYVFDSVKDFDTHFLSLAQSNDWRSNSLKRESTAQVSCPPSAVKFQNHEISSDQETQYQNIHSTVKARLGDEEFVYFQDEDELERYLEPYFKQGVKDSHDRVKSLSNTVTPVDELQCTQVPDIGIVFVMWSSFQGVYQIEFDGASKGNPGKAGAGALLRCPHGQVILELTKYLGNETNNFSEYSSLVLGLDAALSIGIKRIRAQGDSKLVCLQVCGKWKIENVKLLPLYIEVKRLEKLFEEFSIVHVKREFNSGADALANDAVTFGEMKPIRRISKPVPQCCISASSVPTKGNQETNQVEL